MLLQKPDGTAIDATGAIVPAAANTERRVHTTIALGRLLERWKADSRPNLAALLSSYTASVQDLEAAIWDVLINRLANFAVGVQLDTLGKIVGEGRNGLTDDAYRAHIQARILINSSFGRPNDVINMLKVIDSARFKYVQLGPANFRIDYLAPPDPSVAHEIPTLVSQCRAAGVGASVKFVTDGTRGALYGYTATGANATRGWGYFKFPHTSVGGLWGWSQKA